MKRTFALLKELSEQKKEIKGKSEKAISFRYYHARNILESFDSKRGGLDHYTTKYFHENKQIGANGNK
jgi:hypothetical protein